MLALRMKNVPLDDAHILNLAIRMHVTLVIARNDAGPAAAP